MWVRVASFEGGDIEGLRELNEERIASGNMNPPTGVKRALLLATAGGDKRLFVTFFDNRDEIDAAEPHFESMGDEIPEDIRGHRTDVEYYEVLFEGEL